MNMQLVLISTRAVKQVYSVLIMFDSFINLFVIDNVLILCFQNKTKIININTIKTMFQLISCTISQIFIYSNKLMIKVKTQIQNQSLKEFVSGLIGGFISVTICNPLDVARTRMNIMGDNTYKQKYIGFINTMKIIFKQEGWKGYYKGYQITVLSIPLFHSIYFTIYTKMKRILKNQYQFSKIKSVLGATMIAGSISNIVTNPFWVIRTRLMVEVLRHNPIHNHKHNSYTIIKQMLRHEGILSLYKGLSVSLFGLLHACIYFPLYQKMKELMKRDQNELNSFDIFTAAIISKCISSSMTYPHIVIRTILHDSRNPLKSNNYNENTSLKNIIKRIYREHGIKGFYLGLKPDLIRVLPSNAIIFIVYEFLKHRL